jgi:hypothetical protein
LLSGIAIARRSLRLNRGFDGDHTASRKTIETVNGGFEPEFCACSRASFRMVVRRKSESPLATATFRAEFHVRSCIAATLAARMKMNRVGNVVDRLYFVSAKLKMNF